MNDEAFLTQFENQTLDEMHFDHLGHLRLAWLYLSENELDEAIDLVVTGIKAYAESLGATTKFHLTITNSIMRIIQQRMLLEETQSWQVFLEKNSDLVNNLKAILHQHFSADLLASEVARTTLVKPDLKPI